MPIFDNRLLNKALFEAFRFLQILNSLIAYKTSIDDVYVLIIISLRLPINLLTQSLALSRVVTKFCETKFPKDFCYAFLKISRNFVTTLVFDAQVLQKTKCYLIKFLSFYFKNMYFLGGFGSSVGLNTCSSKARNCQAFRKGKLQTILINSQGSACN
jgi:hypothetical protein